VASCSHVRMICVKGFSVDGQENIQEILSKRLYLCQFLCALMVLKAGEISDVIVYRFLIQQSEICFDTSAMCVCWIVTDSYRIVYIFTVAAAAAATVAASSTTTTTAVEVPA